MKLQGVCVLLTRSYADNEWMRRTIESLGGGAVESPLIQVELQWDERLPAALRTIHDYHAVVATSHNAFRAVEMCSENIDGGMDVRCYVVGERSANQARTLGWVPVCVPGVKRASDLVPVLVQMTSALPMTEYIYPTSSQGVVRPRLLWLRGQLADTRFSDTLRLGGWVVDEVICYTTNRVPVSDLALDTLLVGLCPVIPLYSPSAVHSLVESPAFMRLVSRHARKSVHLLAIGQTTAAAIKAHGLHPAGVADNPTDDAMLQLIEQCAVTYLHN